MAQRACVRACKANNKKKRKDSVYRIRTFLLLVTATSPDRLSLLGYMEIETRINRVSSICRIKPPLFPFCADGNAAGSVGNSFMDFAATDAFQIVWMAIQTNRTE